MSCFGDLHSGKCQLFTRYFIVENLTAPVYYKSLAKWQTTRWPMNYSTSCNLWFVEDVMYLQNYWNLFFHLFCMYSVKWCSNVDISSSISPLTQIWVFHSSQNGWWRRNAGGRVGRCAAKAPAHGWAGWATAHLTPLGSSRWHPQQHRVRRSVCRQIQGPWPRVPSRRKTTMCKFSPPSPPPVPGHPGLPGWDHMLSPLSPEALWHPWTHTEFK